MNEVAHAIAVIESSGDAIVGRTPNGMVTSWNPAAEALYGYSSAEMMGHSIVNLVPADRAGETADMLARVLRGDRVTQYQTVRLHKDGHPIPISLTVSPIRDNSGTIIGVSHISRDMSEQVALQEERDRFFTLSLDMLCVAGMDGVFRRLNPAWETTLGYSLEELMSQPYLNYVHPDDRAKTIMEMEKLSFQGNSRSFENRYRAKDGTYKSILWTAAPYAAGKLVYASAKDVTDRRAAEEKLADSERRFRALSSSSPVGIFETDTAGLCVYTNSRWQSITGMSGEDALGEGWVKTLHPADAEAVIGAWGEAIRDNHDFEMEFRIRTPEREIRWVHSEASAMNDASDDLIGHVGTVQDITERKQAQDDAQRNGTLLAAQNAELEAFTYSVSHDLQEPLRTISAFSGILVDDYQSLLPEEARTHLDRIRSASDRMKQLILDLLSLSAASRLTIEPQPLDVATVLGDVVSSLNERIAKTGTHIVIADDLPTVFADRTRLQQVFRNLIDNGVKYNENPAPLVEIGVRSTSTNEVTLFVRDNGIGINERYHDRIFDIFQRLHLREEYDGTGAGLAIVKRAVEALNGRVWVESVEGLGSTFLLTLPIPNEDVGTKAA